MAKFSLSSSWWCYRAVQFLAGILLAGAFAPYNLWPLALAALALFYHAQITATTLRVALVRGFWFGYGFSIAAHYWIAYSLLIDARQFGWLVPFCVLGLSAAMAVWWVVCCLVFWWAKPTKPVPAAGVFCLVFVLIEYAKSFGIFGFPWNLMGYVWLAVPAIAQAASVVGVYGLSLLLMLVVVALYHARHARYAALAVLLMVAGMYGWGQGRMQTPLTYSDVTVRLVQPNIAQNMKWSADAASATMGTLAALSKQAAVAAPRLVIWPETAIPFTLTSDASWQGFMQAIPSDAALITGVVRRDAGGRLYNSIAWVSGEQVSLYDKFQRVPFGEFVPFRALLPIDKITPGGQDFSRGKEGAVLTQGVLTARPLVCYESIFPHLAAGDTRTDFLLNLTNDAWFGDSPGPYQHLAMAQVRAIEQGLPLLRVANTGVSAVVSPYGVLLVHLPLGSAGVLDHSMPTPLADTLYTRGGYYWLWGAALLVMLLILARMRVKY